MKKVGVVSLAQTCMLDLLFISTIYYQNMSKGIKVMERTRFWELLPAQDFGFRGDNYITKKMRVVSLASNMPTGPPLHSYQILPKYV